MPRGQHVVYSGHCGIPVPVLAGDADPYFAPRFAKAAPQLVRVHVDHQRDPSPFVRVFFAHHGHVPPGRRPVEDDLGHDWARTARRDVVRFMIAPPFELSVGSIGAWGDPSATSHRQ